MLHRAVLALDPDAARKRREKAQRDARVECWTEPAGTWSLAGRDLPPAAVLAADRHIDTAARDLKNAGAGGTLEQLRAAVFLALLTSRPLYTLLPGQDDGSAAGESGTGDGPGGNGPGRPGETGPARTATAARTHIAPGQAARTATAPAQSPRTAITPAPGTKMNPAGRDPAAAPARPDQDQDQEGHPGGRHLPPG